jgi:hypothetical protein
LRKDGEREQIIQRDSIGIVTIEKGVVSSYHRGSYEKHMEKVMKDVKALLETARGDHSTQSTHTNTQHTHREEGMYVCA